MATANVKLTADGSEAKEAVRQVGKEAQKSAKKLTLLQRKLRAINILESRLGANLNTRNFDSILKKFDETEKRLRDINRGTVSKNISGRQLADKMTTGELGKQETKLDRMNKQYAQMNKNIKSINREMSTTTRQAKALEKEIETTTKKLESSKYKSPAQTGKLLALENQLNGIYEKRVALRKKWKDAQGPRDLLGAQIASARGVDLPKANEFYKQQEKNNSVREKLEKNFTNFANKEADKRASYSKRLYKKEWADAIKENKRINAEKLKTAFDYNEKVATKTGFINQFGPKGSPLNDTKQQLDAFEAAVLNDPTGTAAAIEKETAARKKANKQLISYDETLRSVNKEITRQQDLMDKLPRNSKAGKLLRKDFEELRMIQSHFFSENEKDFKKGTKLFDQHRATLDKNRRSVKNMGRSYGFAGSKLAKFSIAMSGIAATLFVFQTVARVIGVIVGTITKMERAMAKFRIQGKLSGDEMARLKNEAIEIGRTGYTSGDKYLTQIGELQGYGIAPEDARSELQQAIKREQQAGAGTLDRSLKEFVGEIRHLTRNVMTPLADDISSAAKWLASIAKALSGDTNAERKAATDNNMKASGYARSGYFKLKDYYDTKDLAARQKMIDKAEKMASIVDPHQDQKNRANVQNAAAQQIRVAESFIDAHEEFRLGVEASTKSLGKMTEQIDTSVRDRKFKHNVPGLDEIVKDAARANGISTDLIWSVMKQESNFDPNATSVDGARGLMQLMPATAKELGITDITDPRQNVMGGSKYLRQMLDKYDGDRDKAVVAYNWGPGHLDEYGMGKMPQETITHLQTVNQNMAMLSGTLETLSTTTSQAAYDVMLFADGTGKIQWAELRGDQEQTMQSMKSNINDLKYFFNMTGKNLPGQYYVQDEQANARVSNIRRGLKRTGMSDQQADSAIERIRDQMDFERDQANLEPLMRDYKFLYNELGQTSEAYWANEFEKNSNFIELLRLRNSLADPSDQIAESDIDSLMFKLDKKTKNEKIRPRLEDLEEIREVTNITAPYLKENDISKIRSKYSAMMPKLSDDEQKLAKISEQSEIADLSLKELSNSLDSVQKHYEATGLSADKYYSLQLNSLELIRQKQAADPNIGLKTANEMYKASVRDLDKNLVEKSLESYEIMYETTNKMSQEYLNKQLQLIEIEKQARIDLTGDVAGALRAADRQTEELMNEYAVKGEGQSGNEIMTGIQAGLKRYDLEKDQITMAENISNVWTSAAEESSQAWETMFFTVMRGEFDSLEDVALNVLRAIQNAMIGTLYEMIDFKGIFKGVLSGIGSGSGIEIEAGTGNKAFASGGMITEPVVGIGTRSGRSYEIGESGPEMVMPLNKLGGGNSGGGVNITPAHVDVVINNHTGQPTQQSEQQTPGGRRQIMVTIGSDITGGGPTARALERRYGLTPRGTRTYS